MTGIPESNFLTIAILVVICVVYTLAVFFGMKGVARLASSCIYLFFIFCFMCSSAGDSPGTLSRRG